VGNIHELVADDVYHEHVNGVAPDIHSSEPHMGPL